MGCSSCYEQTQTQDDNTYLIALGIFAVIIFMILLISIIRPGRGRPFFRRGRRRPAVVLRM